MERQQNLIPQSIEIEFDISKYLNLEKNESPAPYESKFYFFDDTFQTHVDQSPATIAQNSNNKFDRVSKEQLVQREQTKNWGMYARKSNQNRHKKCQTLANRTLRKIGLKKYLAFLKKCEGKYYYILAVFLLAKHYGIITDFKKEYTDIVQNNKEKLMENIEKESCQIKRKKMQAEMESMNSSLEIVKMVEAGEIYNGILRLYHENLKRGSLIDSAFDFLEEFQKQVKEKFCSKKMASKE